jgi:tetratricopeptide (TPR) repeat protein
MVRYLPMRSQAKKTAITGLLAMLLRCCGFYGLTIALQVILLLLAVMAIPARTDSQASIREAYTAGEQALKRGDLDAAEKAFRQVLELAPTDVGARVNLGVVDMRRHKWKQALENLNQAEKLAPQITGIRLNIGLAYYREADYKDAIPPFESVLRDQPQSNQASHLLGLCYFFGERYADAVNTLEPLWPASQNDLSYLYVLSVAAGNAGRHDLEDQALKQLLEVGRGMPALHLLLGKGYLSRSQEDQAIAEMQLAAQADDKLPYVHYYLGLAYRQKRNLEKAKDEFSRDLALHAGASASDTAVAYDYDQLGIVAYLQQQNQAAQRDFEEAVKREPGIGTSWYGLAKIYRDQGRYNQALKAIDHAMTIDPNSASVHYLRSQILTQLGRKEEAQTDLVAVRRLQHDSLDQLEKQMDGGRYHDPQLAQEPPVQ